MIAEIEIISKLVCETWGIPLSRITADSRKREIVEPRQAAMYLAKAYTSLPPETISRELGRKRLNVFYSYKVISDYMESDPIVRKKIRSVEERLPELLKNAHIDGAYSVTRSEIEQAVKDALLKYLLDDRKKRTEKARTVEKLIHTTIYHLSAIV